MIPRPVVGWAGSIPCAALSSSAVAAGCGGLPPLCHLLLLEPTQKSVFAQARVSRRPASSGAAHIVVRPAFEADLGLVCAVPEVVVAPSPLALWVLRHTARF